jgi:hypothetical protein
VRGSRQSEEVIAELLRIELSQDSARLLPYESSLHPPHLVAIGYIDSTLLFRRKASDANADVCHSQVVVLPFIQCRQLYLDSVYYMCYVP